MLRLLIAAAGLILAAAPLRAAEVKVAVAANFTAPAKEIAKAFAEVTGHQAVLSFGSTGKLYAQIVHGAPFQVFLAADAARPERAEAEGLAVPGSRFTYATGRLALFSPDESLVDDGGQILGTDRYRRLAIANPQTAPYGKAALEVLSALGVADKAVPRLVRGDNIAQTFQFVASGNAELGLVSLSQLTGRQGGSRWVVPAELHEPIVQQAVLLMAGETNAAAKAFLAFLAKEPAAAIIESFGYGFGRGRGRGGD
ncbi:MAG: molybdate ABC transporter substrate-binding protein [Rhodospirillales bacterium]